MMTLHTLTSLQRRHAALDEALRKERSHPAPNFVRLMRLKRRELALKDAIAVSTRNVN
ncbi:MAG: DUF465 domain-containing protein [Alphaproteobacteria bacterium]|nr:MAG: DUF465 domain-containing protein [Alphaproteobacteria bacterium]